MTPDLRFQTPAPAPRSRAAIAARIPARPDGWTGSDDLALMEGLFRGLGLSDIGEQLGKPFGVTQARFRALRKAAVGEGPFTLAAQTALLEIAREQAA